MVSLHSPWDIPSSWHPALNAAASGGTIFLLGAVDSGKTTLAAILANAAVQSGRRTAVVDADTGQSSIGPPSCVGMATVADPVASLEELSAEAIDFVGNPSPVGHLLQCVVSTHVMVRAAREKAETIIVDTTGLISGSPARALKTAKIQLLDPEVIIAIQQEDEVEHLLTPYQRRARPHIIRLRSSRRVKERSRNDRSARRQRKLGAYFAGGGLAQLSWDNIPVENSAWTAGKPAPGYIRAHAEELLGCEVKYAERQTDGLLFILAERVSAVMLRRLKDGFEGNVRAINIASLDHLLVGLLGERGETVGLGILEEIDFAKRRSSIFTPWNDMERIHGLRLGSIRITRGGTELGWNEPGDTG